MLGLALLLPGRAARAQNWARKMFPVVSHDFGTVARGATAEVAFTFTNLYQSPVEVAEVRSSCGCTQPRIEQRQVASGEEGSIIAALDTRSFNGTKSATITVVFRQPYAAEVQLSVRGNIRADVVCDPGVVDFGSIPQGTTAERRVKVAYAGNPNWRIVDVRSAYPHFEVELEELRREGSRVDYEMLVRLTAEAPASYVQGQLTLITNETRANDLTLPVQGRVRSAITVSPTTLLLGQVPVGQAVSRKLVVRGEQPFRVLRVECDDDGFEFGAASTEARKLHVIPVMFHAGTTPGQVARVIRIVTDCQAGSTAECDALGDVVP